MDFLTNSIAAIYSCPAPVVSTDSVGEGLGKKLLLVSLFSFSQSYFYADRFPHLASLELPKIPTNTAGATKGRPCAGFGGSLPLEMCPGEIHVKSQPYL